ncbi:MAG TPA: hypothetical protein VF699_05650 [Caulobacteraceae bacterium]|jgi:hypothetical protein
MNSAIVDLLLKEYTRVGSEIWTPLLDCLVSARSYFEGDLDLLIIYLLIGLRTLQDPRTLQLSLQAVAEGRVATLPSLFTNVRSIAASTGIPYETVRRKVARLVELGWVSRDDDKLALTVRALTEFTDLRAKLFELVTANHDTVSKLLKRAS